jgi:hypothetical protein
VSSTAFPGLNIAVTQSPTPALGVFTHAAPGSSSSTNPNLAPQYAAWQSWRRDIESAKTTLPVDPDRVYMIRWTTTVQPACLSALSPQTPDVRFRVGDPTNLGLGQAHDVLPAPGANGIVGSGTHVHRSYYYAPSNTPANAEIGFMFDVFDFYQGDGGGFYTEGAANYGLDLQKMEVFSLQRDELAGETIELNAGNPSAFATGDGTTPPTAGATPFTLFDFTTAQHSGDWEFRASSYVSDGSSNRNPARLFSPNKLSMSLGTGSENVIGTWDTRGFVLRQKPDNFAPQSTAKEIVSGIPNNKLLCVDAWLSSPQGSASNNHLPVMRLGFSTDMFGETGLSQDSPRRYIMQGRVSYSEFRAWNRTDAGDLFVSVPSTLALGTTPRRYTAVMEPMIRAGSTIDVRPFIQFWSFPLDLTATPDTFRDDRSDAGTMEIHRVVITSYDLPAYPVDCTSP